MYLCTHLLLPRAFNHHGLGVHEPADVLAPGPPEVAAIMYVWHGGEPPPAGLEAIQGIDASWIESEGTQDLTGLVVA